MKPAAAVFAALSDGNLWSTGQPHLDGAVVSLDVLPLGPIGTYTVNYRVTSADGTWSPARGPST